MPETWTQDTRFLKISTPLGPDKLFLRDFSGAEEISKLSVFQLDLISQEPEINPQDIVAKNVTVALEHTGGARYFNGYISSFAALPNEGHFFHYQAELVPWTWFLTLASDCRIFQEMTVPEILEDTFARFGFHDYELHVTPGAHPKREFCVQYRETAYNFCARLMEQEGIFHFYRHENGKHTMVIADNPSVHKDCPILSEIPLLRATSSLDTAIEGISHWEHHYEFRSGQWTQTDYNFEDPKNNLFQNVQTVVELPGNKAFELYDYPGEYLVKKDGEELTKTRMEEEEARHDIVRGDSGCSSLAVGHRFTLKEHPAKKENRRYILTAVDHSARQTGFGQTQAEDSWYRNTFVCIPDSVKFRPPRDTPKPLVQGMQTAVVVGPKGQEIYTDKYGRVKVQFHWDRLGKWDEKSSCWIRVSHLWAGSNWGGIFNPRIGQEVIVDFLEGDPDRPIVTGRVYNALQMPPYDLPDNQTQSGIKSRSSKDGSSSNFNEIRFEDKKGGEEVYIHAERNLTTVVEANESRSVGGSRSTTIQKDETIVIKDGDRTETLQKGSEEITFELGSRKVTLNVGDDELHLLAGSRTVTAMAGDHKTTALKVSIMGLTELTLMCGASAIKMTPAMISIDSPLVKINS